jgi:hypothetical protein
LDAALKRFVLWEADAYGQINPQPLNAKGEYRLYLPSGTYYLRIAAGGYKTIVSSIFSVTRPTPLVSSFAMTRARAIKIGSWFIPLPDFRQIIEPVDLHISERVIYTKTQSRIGLEFPYFRFENGADAVISTSFRGKPTLVTFINTWLPQAAAQLSILSELATKKELNIVVIVPQETASSVALYKKRASISFTVVADPDGDLIDTLAAHTLPTHILVDRKGIIRSIQTGLYDKEQLLDMLIK